LKKVPKTTLVGTSIGHLLEMAPNPRWLAINVLLKVDNRISLLSKTQTWTFSKRFETVK
jgi:hypothetical protein